MRPPTPTPGPWAGAMVWATSDGICMKSTNEKWNKAKALIHQLQQELREIQGEPSSQGINFKELESARGFLVHMQWTYPALTPYLKGFHLNLDSWRPGRDAEGWKDKRFVGEEGFWDESEQSWISWDSAPRKAPTWLQPAPRYINDLQALSNLLAGDLHPLHYLCQNKIHVALYGFVDASGQGIGSSFGYNEGVAYSYGIWGRDEESYSSNYRELSNLVTSFEQMALQDQLHGAKVFVFTDNATAKAAFL
jgi:hypothetical protein